MRIDPAIAQLRCDPAPQFEAQAALEAVCEGWRNMPEVAALLGDLREYGEGAALADCPVLDCAVSDLEVAQRILGSLISSLTEVLARQPLGHVPLRHQYSQGLAVLQLASAGSAALSLMCYEARPRTGPAETVCFAGGERRELCLAGAADARFFEILREDPGHADLDCDSRLISAGDALTFSGPRHTKIVDRPHQCVIMLRVSRGGPRSTPAREYRIADGALVHCASGDRAESRDEMAAAVLGAMQRHDAAPVLAELAHDAASSDHLRWQSLCQALALDTATGFAALTVIASDVGDILAPPAGALRASLIERHPSLADWGPPCRA